MLFFSVRISRYARAHRTPRMRIRILVSNNN